MTILFRIQNRGMPTASDFRHRQASCDEPARPVAPAESGMGSATVPVTVCNVPLRTPLHSARTPNAAARRRAPPNRPSQTEYRKRAMPISDCEFRIAECATGPFRRSGFREKAAIQIPSQFPALCRDAATLRFSGERLFLSANDVRKRAKRIVYGLGIGENFCHVRLQDHHVRAALVAPEVFAAHAARKIVFRPQAVAG